MDWGVWGPPIAVLVISSVTGLVLIGRVKDQEQIDQKPELLARKSQILEAIRELDADQSKMEATAYEEERERLIQQASEVLQELDHEGSDAVQPLHSERVNGNSLFVYAVGSLLFFALVGFLVTKYSAARQEGGVMTGGQMSESQSRAIDWAKIREERLAKATKTLADSPENVAALNVLTYDSLLARDMQASMEHMEKVRQIKPQDPDFLVHLAILQMSVGMFERAEVSLTQVLNDNPNMPKALLWQGYLFANMGKKEEAKASLDAITTSFSWPEEQYFLETMKADLSAPPAMITGTVTVPTSAIPPQGTLFIIAKRNNMGGGPPLAVKKIPNPSFPLDFELGKGDMIMGGSWPETVYLSVRLDHDGNAMTKDPTDWQGRETKEVKGVQENLVLELVAP